MTIPPICWWCKHFNVQVFEKEHKTTCEAFPDDIPEEIWINEVIHQTTYQGDNGIQFEKQENYDELPLALKLTLEVSPLSIDEALEWTINLFKEYQQRK